ncbi:hypothetical protein ACLB2K_035147 [Fragaria x ananassa]
MTDEVSTHFATTLTIREDSPAISDVISRTPAALAPSFAIGRLLSMKKRLTDPKVVNGTLTSVWDLHNRLQVRSVGDRYLLKLSRLEDRRHLIQGGPWFFGRSNFILSEYDGLSEVTTVPILSMPVWVKIFGLSPQLFTEGAAGKVEDLIGQVLFPNKIGLRRGIRTKVWLIHDISDPVREAFPPMPFEFVLGDRKTMVMLSFKYERVVGFCRVCGLLEHRSPGCGGPPDVTKGLGLDRVRSNPLPAAVNPFSGGVLSAQNPSSSSSQSGSIFSILGVSASELARQLALFKSSFPSLLPSLGKGPEGPPIIQIPAAVYNTVIGVKRDVD